MRRAAIALAALVLASCGGGGQDAQPVQEGPAVLNPPDTSQEWAVEDVVQALDLGPDPAQVDLDRDLGIESEANTTPSGCMVDVVMTSAQEIDTYASAGDTVVTNPDATAGVKVTASDDPGCLGELEQGLEALTRP